MPHDVEWLDGGPAPALTDPPRVGPSRHMRRSVLGVALALALAAAALLSIRSHRAGQPAIAAVPTHQTVRSLGHPLLGITGAAVLYLRGPGVVVRIELARGRVTMTPLPGLRSSGPVSFLAMPSGALVRPLDLVPGYLVPDGGPPAQLGGPLASGLALPGPRPGELWVIDDSGGSTSSSQLVLLGADGSRRYAARVPTSDYGPPTADGSGYLLQSGSDGSIYDFRPDGTQLVVRHGVVLASGAGRWLTADCDAGSSCPAWIVQAGQRTPTPVGTQDVAPGQPVGSISPDGTVAALLRPKAGVTQLRLVDLRTGAGRDTHVTLSIDAGASALAFTPDSSRIVVATADGSLQVVDVRSGAVRSLGVSLPPVRQVSIRD